MSKTKKKIVKINQKTILIGGLVTLIFVSLLVFGFILSENKKLAQDEISQNKANIIQENKPELMDLDSKFDKYKKEVVSCGLNITTTITNKQWTTAKNQVNTCSLITTNFYTELLSSYSNSTNFNPIKIDVAGDSASWISLTKFIALIEKIDSSTQTNNLINETNETISAFNEVFLSMLKLRIEYPYFYTKEYSKFTSDWEQNYELYAQLNQITNNYFDSQYGYLAKYFLQVNPNNSSVKYIVDNKLTSKADDEQIKWDLFNYVRDEIDYKHDPNWQSDWVHTPAYTLVTKEGDCDDHAVLLASLFMKAGIQDVQLCFTTNHAYVAVSNIGWDATCKNCGNSSMGAEEFYTNSKCYEINSYISDLKPNTYTFDSCYDSYSYCYTKLTNKINEVSSYNSLLQGQQNKQTLVTNYNLVTNKQNELVSIMNECMPSLEDCKQTLKQNQIDIQNFIDNTYKFYEDEKGFLSTVYVVIQST